MIGIYYMIKRFLGKKPPVKSGLVYVEKAKRVVGSCRTKEQLDNALKYLQLARKKGLISYEWLCWIYKDNVAPKWRELAPAGEHLELPAPDTIDRIKSLTGAYQ